MDRICRALVAAGHHVTLVGREKKTSPPLTEKPYRQHRLPLHFEGGKLFYLEYNWKLWRWLRKQSFDALNSVDLDTLLAGYLATRNSQKWVFDAHEYFSETPEVIHRPLVRKTWQRLARWLVPKTDVCYTVGAELAKIFQQEYGVKFGVVRNVPWKDEPQNSVTSPATDAPKSKEKIILYQGMLNHGRGLETAMEAMRLLPPDFTLWLAGNGDIAAKLQSSSVDLQEQGRVRFLGFVPMAELPELTHQAWLGLNLLDAVSPSYYYSLANKCFDYIQAGVPSVQMDFPEYRALQDTYHCFVLLPTLNATKLASLIQSVAADPTAYHRLLANNQRAATDLNWEREQRGLLGLWEELKS